MKRIVFSCLILILVAATLNTSAQISDLDPRPKTQDPKLLIFVSSFASGENGGGIQSYQFDTKTGTLKFLHRTTGAENPFFLAVTPNQKYLYSIHAQKFGGQENEEVGAYAINKSTGELKLLNRQSTRGTASCYLDVDATGKTLLVACYTTGSVASLPISDDGSLGEITSFIQHYGSSILPDRQQSPHAHCIAISPDNRFAYAADLGLDQILGYTLNAAGSKLSPNRQAFVRTPPGGGPRHLTFHPNGRRLYVINEIGNTVTLFDYDPESGILIERQTISTLPKDFTGTTHTADVKITPDGRFLYGTNRGHDTIAAYRIADDGTLSLIAITPSLGKGPQNLAITPGGEFLLCANLPSNNIAVFRIDRENGSLKSVGDPVFQPSPSCIRILP